MRLDEIRDILADTTPDEWVRAPRPPLGGGPESPPGAGIYIADNDLAITWGLVTHDSAHIKGSREAQEYFGASTRLGVVDAFWRGTPSHRQFYLVLSQGGHGYLPLPPTWPLPGGEYEIRISDSEVGLIHVIHDLDDKADYFGYLVRTGWLIETG